MTLSYSQWLRWAVSHLDVLQSLASLAAAFISAETLADKWTVIVGIGNLLLPVINDFPTVSVSSDETDEVLEANVLSALSTMPTAQGIDLSKWDGRRLRQIWDVVAPLLPVLIGLLR